MRGFDRTMRQIGVAFRRPRSVIARRGSATAAAAAAASASHGKLSAGLKPRGFFVDDIECRQADVGDFLLAEKNFLTLTL